MTVGPVRDEVLEALGFDLNSENEHEQKYLQQIETALSQSYEGDTQAEKNDLLQSALDAIMEERSNDKNVDSPEGNEKRSSFSFDNENEIRQVFDNLVSDYEDTINEWVPDVPDSEERLSLISLSWNGLLGIRYDSEGNVEVGDNGNILYKSPSLRRAILNDSRSEAWFEIRYNTNEGST